MQRHRYSFFGQKSGILFDSGDDSQPFLFLSFVKKKQTGQWERPTNGEGKNIKFNLGEILHILRILSQTNAEWSTVHKFQTETTPISWKNVNEVIQISIPGYSKLLKFPESKLFHDLLAHVYQEKIEKSTAFQKETTKYLDPKENLQHRAANSHNLSPNDNQHRIRSNLESNTHSSRVIMESSRSNHENGNSPQSINPNSNPNIDPSKWLENLQVQDDFCLVPGELTAQREKAIAFKVSTFNQIWVPKSVIRDQQIEPDLGGLWIKHWFLTKKLEDIFNIAA